MSGTLSNLLSQSFSTVKVPNTRLALYTLSIRSPGHSSLSFFTYTFPISPGALRKAPTAMSAIYDTSGPVLKNGVKRDVDSFGLTPPMYTLEGTTGWDRHQTDGLIFTGLQSIQQLQYLISLYAQLNQAQKQANNPSLYTMEFYDYFNQEFWQVEPMGEMEISQSERAPTLQYYRCRLERRGGCGAKRYQQHPWPILREDQDGTRPFRLHPDDLERDQGDPDVCPGELERDQSGEYAAARADDHYHTPERIIGIQRLPLPNWYADELFCTLAGCGPAA
jgi:hypothetical protein